MKWQEAKWQEEGKLRQVDHDAAKVEHDEVYRGMDRLGPRSGRTIGNLNSMNTFAVHHRHG
jgi:hypothetical protein